jgi:hypothetical protein
VILAARHRFAAYGDRARPFSRNNLILTGSLLARQCDGCITTHVYVPEYSANEPSTLVVVGEHDGITLKGTLIQDRRSEQ